MQSEDLSNQQAAVVLDVCEQLQMSSSVDAHMLVEMGPEKSSLSFFFFFFSFLICGDFFSHNNTMFIKKKML